MLKFFRRIRQNFLNDNKYRMYAIYAIGEIILVMIGILLALQVNNWNDCLLYTSPSPRDLSTSRMPSSA